MAGETVRHEVFGEGTVISSRLVEADEEVTVAFEGRGIKRLLQSYAQAGARHLRLFPGDGAPAPGVLCPCCSYAICRQTGRP